jgi:Flp pilus assembly secretin CpaC
MPSGAQVNGNSSGDQPQLDPLSPEDIEETRQLRPPIRLDPNQEKREFTLSGDSRALWEQVSKAFGLEVIFDSDYQPVSNLRFRIGAVGAEEALRDLELATASFLVPVSERMILVARESQQKRQELEQTIAVSVPIPTPVTLQEAQEIARTVQQLMELQKFGIDSARRIVVMRDRITKVVPALAVLRQLLHHRPELEIEMEFLEVIQNSTLDYGLALPTSFPLTWLGNFLPFKTFIPQGYTNFATFGGGASLFGIGISSAEAFARFSNAATRTLIRTELRTSDGQAAQFHMGDKYPVMTTGYFGPTEEGQEVFRPPPVFNFEDLGVLIKVTPKVHGWGDITLDVDAEYKVLTGQALNGIPVIANRKLVSQARVRPGEYAVLAGLVRASEARVITGMAGLAQIPALGVLFRQNNKSKESGETLFVIKPRLLSPPLSEVLTPPLWTGSETKPRLAL